MRKVTASLLLVFLMVFMAGCFSEKKEEKKTAAVSILKSGEKLNVTAGEKLAGIEIEFDKAVAKEDILSANGNLVISNIRDGKTVVAVVVNNQKENVLFTINNDGKYEGINAKVIEKAASVNEAAAKTTLKRAGEKLLGDFNGDDKVDVQDFNLFAANYFGAYDAKYDISPAQKSAGDWANIYSLSQPDGKVSIFDFIIFGENYGKSNPVVTVTSVVINKPTSFTGNIDKGTTATLAATVTYSNATTTTTADWTSSNTAVATVVNGVVTAVAEGTAVITASKGGKSDTVTVNVTVPATGITIYVEKPDAWSEIWMWFNTNNKQTWDTSVLKAPPGDLVNYRTGWYKKVLPTTATSIEFLFNDGTWTNKMCAEGFNKGSTALNFKATKSIWIKKDATTSDVDPVGPKAPTITLSPASFTKAAGTYPVDVTVAANDGTMETVKYTTDNTDPATSATAKTLANTGGQVTITLTAGATVNLKVYAKNNIGPATANGVYTEGVVTASAFSWNNAAVYFVLTDRFYNGNTANDKSYGRKTDYGSAELNSGTFHGGDIAGLTKKLNDGYFTDLGINAIWISAPYEQVHGWAGGGDSTKNNKKTFPHYAYHGYYVQDYTEMDQNMGTVEEFRTFVNTAHSKGIRIVVDVVMNHTGYNTYLDMEKYGFGGFTAGCNSSWEPSDGLWDTAWKAVDWNTTNWGKWWSNDWIAAGLPTYNKRTSTVDQDPIQSSLAGLPDFRTETTTGVAAPPFLKTKWGMESTGYDNWIIPAAKSLRADLNVAPAIYEEKWLAAWVEEFGIDGFRCDTAKHIEQYRWGELKVAADAALAKWRANNPSDPASKWTDKFWMTGEVWGHGLTGDDGYFSTGKFDSLINFQFPKDGNLGSIGATWQNYANTINGSNTFNVLSYLNSHDHKENYGWTQTNMNHGTALLLAPGGVQVYYGDEYSRTLGAEVSDLNQSTRSDFNWSTYNNNILAHWKKVGQFRNRHISVGAGSQTDLTNNTYGRVYNKNGIEDKVVINLNGSGSVAVNVSGIFADGTAVKNFYNGETGTVSGGKVTFTASNGVILIEKQ